MKKKLYLIFGLLMSLLLVGVVNAKGPYYLDWETEEIDDRSALGNFVYQEGYLTVDVDEDGYIITTFDKTGKELKTKSFDTVEIIDVATYEDEIFIVTYVDSADEELYLEKYNSNLEQVAAAEIDSYISEMLKELGLDAIYVSSNEVGIPSVEGIAIFNHDLEFVKMETSSSSVKKYYPAYIAARDLYNDIRENGNIYVDSMANKDNLFAVGVYRGCSSGPDVALGTAATREKAGVDSDCTSTLSLELYDEDGNQKWSVELINSGYVREIEFLDNYIAAIVPANNGYSLNIYDMSGELVQTIKSSLGFGGITSTAGGFIVGQGYCDSSLNGASYYSGPSTPVTGPFAVQTFDQFDVIGDSCCTGERKDSVVCTSNHQVYYLNRGIVVDVTSGKGTVEVASEQRPGEPVTFVVTPEKGYVIGVIKVTDANGNVLTFTDNTFTMPDANVTIEVEFLVENAKTADIAIKLIIVLAILSSIVMIINKRKLLELK